MPGGPEIAGFHTGHGELVDQPKLPPRRDHNVAGPDIAALDAQPLEAGRARQQHPGQLPQRVLGEGLLGQLPVCDQLGQRLWEEVQPGPAAGLCAWPA